LRFWEPTLGVEQPAGQRIAFFQRSYLGSEGEEARRAHAAARDALFPALGLAPEADELDSEEVDALRKGLQRVAADAKLPGVRAELFVDAARLQLEQVRLERGAQEVERRIECLAQLAPVQGEPADAPGGAEPTALPAECRPTPAHTLRVGADSLKAKPLVEAGATPSFLEVLEEQVDGWVEALDEDPDGQVADPQAPVALRLAPADDPSAGLSVVVERWRDGSDRTAELEDLKRRAERYDAAARVQARTRRELALLDAQLFLVSSQVVPELRRTTVPEDSEGRRAWTVTLAPELQEVFDGREQARLGRWLQARPGQVQEFALQLPKGPQRERFLHYVSQTQHWHLRDPEAILAELARAEDEQRRTPELGSVNMPPVMVCRAMGQHKLDAAVVQLAYADRRRTKKMKLLLVQRDPCLVVWEHSVPIYSHADVLGSTVDDAKVMTAGAHRFFAAYPLGTDYLGRDMLKRLVKGTEGFFLPGLIAVALGLGIGVLLGALAGYLGGTVDKVISFFTTMLGSFPRLVFILLVCTIPDEPSMKLIGAMTGVLFIPQVAEAVRRRVLALKAEDFILASRAHGLSLPRILFYHIVWLQCFPEIVRQALYLFVYVIFLETALSYLEGPGAPPEIPSWGRMLANATAAMFRGQYWHALVPTAAIVFTTLGVAALGDVIVGQAKEERL